ncbi:MAG TPA: MMPL family transporter [Acidimicrobiia bacterium]|nr:MMPL family transporter [Acidimicrobiia bacterium]
MKTLVNAISGAVRKAPWVVIISTVVLSMALGALSGNFTPAEDQNESFAPEAPELEAQATIGELFGSGQSALQVLIEADSGDVITLDGLAATTAIEESVRSSDLSEFLADSPESPAVASFMAPVAFAISEGAPAPTSDAELKATYSESYGQIPSQQRGFVDLLLPADADPTSAQTDVGVLVISYESSSDFDEGARRAQLAADAVERAQLAPGVTADPFNQELIFANQDDFSAEILRMFLAAGFIIVTVLAAVYLLRSPGALGRSLTIFGFVLLVGAVVLVTLPALAAIFPDALPESIANWEIGPVALAGAGTVVLVFAIWSVASGRLRRTVADTVLTIVTIGFAISWMNGIGYLIFGDQGPMTQILPILLIGLGVDYAIHLTSRYREDVATGSSVDAGIRSSIRTVGIALALATVTTSIGFLTNVFNEIPALREFGALAAVGIVASFLLALTFVPAVREVLDRAGERAGRLDRESLAGNSARLLPKIIGSTAVLAKKAAVAVVIVSLALGALGGWATFTQLEAKFDFLDFVPTTSPIRQTAVTLADRFDFPESTNTLIEGDVSTGEAWNAMALTTSEMATVDNVVVVDGFPLAESPISVIGQLANPDSPTFAPEVGAAAQTVGLGPDLAVQADSVTPLYEAAIAIAPDRMGAVLHQDESGSYDAALFRISTQAGSDEAAALSEDLDDAFSPVAEAGLSPVVTSNEIIGDVVVSTLRDSQVSSLLLTLGAALLLLIINFWIEARRPMLGVITTLPVGLVVLLAFGIMAWLGIPFGPVTATIAALAIGIGIPYMIHITHRYEEDRARCETAEEAIDSTLTFTGGALAGSALTTVAGFGILVVSSTIPFRQFGFVTAYTILLALAAAVLILPSYLYLWDGWHRRRGGSAIDETTLHEALQD